MLMTVIYNITFMPNLAMQVFKTWVTFPIADKSKLLLVLMGFVTRGKSKTYYKKCLYSQIDLKNIINTTW